MFFSDREHRLLLMAIGREQRFIADTKDLTDMLPELNRLEKKINRLCNAKTFKEWAETEVKDETARSV